MPQFILDTGNAESHARFDALPEFMQGYIETAFFCGVSTDDPDNPGESLELDGLGVGNLDADSLADMVADCARFWIDNATLIRQAMEFNPDYSLSQAGGDYWYTRNGHGVGYWDRGLDVIGDALTTAAQHNESGLWAAPLDPETGNPLPGYHCDHDAPSDATPDPDDSELWRVYTDSRVDPLTPDESAALAKLTGETAPDLPASRKRSGRTNGPPFNRDSSGRVVQRVSRDTGPGRV